MLWLPLALHRSKLFQFGLAHALLHAAGRALQLGFLGIAAFGGKRCTRSFLLCFRFRWHGDLLGQGQQGGMNERTTSALEGSGGTATEQSYTLAN